MKKIKWSPLNTFVKCASLFNYFHISRGVICGFILEESVCSVSMNILLTQIISFSGYVNTQNSITGINSLYAA